jgi:hypothetical protein
MVFFVSLGEDTGVDFGVQRLDAAVEHLGKACVVADLGVWDLGCLEGLGGAAGGEDLDVGGDEGVSEISNVGFVKNAEERGSLIHYSYPTHIEDRLINVSGARQADQARTLLLWILEWTRKKTSFNRRLPQPQTDSTHHAILEAPYPHLS